MTTTTAAVSTLSDLSCPKIAEKVVSYVLVNFAEEIALDDLANEAGLSRFNFCRRFQKECGVSPMRWLWNFRTMLAAEFIDLDPKWSLTDIAFSCGFTSSAHFSRSFKQMFGKSPSTYRKVAFALQSNEAGTSAKESVGSYESVFVNNAPAVRRAALSAMSVTSAAE